MHKTELHLLIPLLTSLAKAGFLIIIID